ncbi:hypothetical protein CL653_00940 [bacterium]|nr:hypothetical protein [bacterium]|tara:strand:+ start:922 stop:1356 length:435 start_codon:yes stop_codon:yes gene_type:complete
MSVIRDQSYGVVPVYREGGENKFLLIHQISHRGDKFWSFPKGHGEGTESGRQTALRELEEETSLSAELESNIHFDIHYTFKHEGVQINKTVTYYLGYIASKEYKITQPQEIAEIRFCTFEEAEQLLSHKNSRYVLRQAVEFLTD